MYDLVTKCLCTILWTLDTSQLQFLRVWGVKQFLFVQQKLMHPIFQHSFASDYHSMLKIILWNSGHRLFVILANMPFCLLTLACFLSLLITALPRPCKHIFLPSSAKGSPFEGQVLVGRRRGQKKPAKTSIHWCFFVWSSALDWPNFLSARHMISLIPKCPHCFLLKLPWAPWSLVAKIPRRFCMSSSP